MHAVLCVQENAAQQRHVLQAAKDADVLHRITVAIATQLLMDTNQNQLTRMLFWAFRGMLLNSAM